MHTLHHSMNIIYINFIHEITNLILMSSFCPRVLANVEESIIETQYKSNHSNVYLKPVDMYVPISLLRSNGPLGIIHPPLYPPWLHVHAHGKLNGSQ